ncbi:MAG: TetM/TetW/TetO/TetS family tetracycline resistance ribosomal protection protein [Melioribacteraceae bacterium]|nr:TetM/TetW/TetO/TetS family tetracycline resistance ribosomal protection protein [Melioribacteraceae bacterium]
MHSYKNILNLGIFGHVDAGKTTLTEHILFNTENIRSVGHVDKGTSHSDLMDIEKERGISIKASTISFIWKDTLINLVDTPGHIDFSAEVERTISVIDTAILIVSAVEGIQSHTENIWKVLREKEIPSIIFINKADRVGSSIENVFASLNKEFKKSFIMINKPINEGEAKANIENVFKIDNKKLIESIAENDNELFEKYINEDKIDIPTLQKALKRSLNNNSISPVLVGISKNNIGVNELLDFTIKNRAFPKCEDHNPLAALIYKIEHDPKLGRLAGIRLFSGKIKTRDTIFNSTSQKEVKVSQIKKISPVRFEDYQELNSGEIGYLCGMQDVKIGDIIGESSLVPYNPPMNKPLLTVKVSPKLEQKYSDLANALQILGSEDPHLNFVWYKEEHELQINIMGAIQVEILESLLLNRFNIEVEISQPTVIYKETPSGKGIGTERYTMPKPCWAVVKFAIEPGERGSGIIYSSEVGVNDIHQKYQNEIEMVIPKTLEQGIKGWNVTDIKIRLIEGEDHVMHSRPGDFKLAAFMGIMRGLENCGTDILEPIIRFKISASDEFLGKVSNDIINMRGAFDTPELDNGSFVLTGRYPLASSMDYFVRLSSMTGGKAKLTNVFDGYEICPTELGEIREYKGINPLDRSKFILKWRGAIL